MRRSSRVAEPFLRRSAWRSQAPQCDPPFSRHVGQWQASLIGRYGAAWRAPRDARADPVRSPNRIDPQTPCVGYHALPRAAPGPDVKRTSRGFSTPLTRAEPLSPSRATVPSGASTGIARRAASCERPLASIERPHKIRRRQPVLNEIIRTTPARGFANARRAGHGT